MAAVHEVDLQEYNSSQDIRDVIAVAFWAWYDAHLDDKIVKMKFLFFHVTVRVHHLSALFEILFGPRPF